jgi:TonB family protein
MSGRARILPGIIQPRSSGPGRRLFALLITGFVHLLAVGLAILGQFQIAPTTAPTPAEHIVLVSSSPDEPTPKPHTPLPTDLSPADTTSAVQPRPLPKPAALPIARSREVVIPPPASIEPEATHPITDTQRQPSDVVQEYRQALFDKLADQRHYPEAARLRRHQGDGAVLFRIDRSGALLETSMERSTGRAMLDHAALSQVRRAAPFPAIPPELPDELAVSMPLRFLIAPPGRQIAER